MENKQLLSIYCLLAFCVCTISAFPEKGKWTFDINQENHFVGVSKSMFAGTNITVKVQNCRSESTSLSISWKLRHSPCWQEYLGLENIETNTGQLHRYYMNPHVIPEWLNYSAADYIASEESIATCDGSTISMPQVLQSIDKKHTKHVASEEQPQYVVPKEGVYLFVVTIKPKSPLGGNHSYTAQILIDMKSDFGYLSVIDWPLLPFYGTMCGLYTIMGILWLIVSLCRLKDILRIQMWIGAVLFLGMLEMAVYLAEYESLNKTGELTVGAHYSAELLSCSKRSLARILVLIASMGFGIVKPRLGAMLQRIVGVGVVYMVLSAVETYLILVQPKNDRSRNIYAASFLLALLDAAICFWIFLSLVQTTRTLRLRRNTVKLSLYNHFTNTLIFAVVSSLIFMLWSIYYHRMDTCLKDWKELWLDEAFWKLLFSLLLLVIMILWRPTNNNQRYAFTPLLDSGDETEEDDVMVNENLGMKMRVNRASRANSPSPRTSRDGPSGSIEDDLKWVEENIPSSMVESGLPLLDSEEEIMTTRFELSKMQ
ncbi:transmembrane protein 87A-like [Daphnia carinata]|uniref:transmembrane protein 87A-like n=1 Tax=Daphnia carinata TaxID=120202 RepID=UPI002579B0E7|nr:transmembrane protein 87A-like [Daphnia carinata]